LISQPVASLSSQSSKNCVQPAIAHERLPGEPAQVAAAFARLHALPQPPQSLTVLIKRSQLL
jgi:hypothetical protein